MGWAIIVVLGFVLGGFVAFSCALVVFQFVVVWFCVCFAFTVLVGFAVAWLGVDTAVGQFVFGRLWEFVFALRGVVLVVSGVVWWVMIL